MSIVDNSLVIKINSGSIIHRNLQCLIFKEIIIHVNSVTAKQIENSSKNIYNLELRDKIKTIHTTFDHPYDFGETFDIIVSNPPYIARGDARVNDAATHDPDMALYAKNNGLAAYESIAKNATHWLNPHGKLYLEIGQHQATPVKSLFLKNGWTFIRHENDLGGIERVLVFER